MFLPIDFIENIKIAIGYNDVDRIEFIRICFKPNKMRSRIGKTRIGNIGRIANRLTTEKKCTNEETNKNNEDRKID